LIIANETLLHFSNHKIMFTSLRARKVSFETLNDGTLSTVDVTTGLESVFFQPRHRFDKL